ncbi:hypothetical protein MJO10_30055, partial [Salmonella enterica subsp. enterica serovar Anatum]|nr:hypothetical protein [Salmonella enterica subsp. enterica serovar Anatum]
APMMKVDAVKRGTWDRQIPLAVRQTWRGAMECNGNGLCFNFDLTFLKKLSMAPSYFSSKMNIVVAEDLYPESLEGDEPEPLPQVR